MAFRFRVTAIGCTAADAVVLAACGSSSSSSTTTTTKATTTTTKATSATTMPVTTTTANASSSTTTTAASTTTTSSTSGPPCTAAALQAALPPGQTIVTTDLGYKCSGDYAGSEIHITSSDGSGPPGGYNSDTLFQASGSNWVDIGRSPENCSLVPAEIHVYCTVS